MHIITQSKTCDRQTQVICTCPHKQHPGQGTNCHQHPEAPWPITHCSRSCLCSELSTHRFVLAAWKYLFKIFLWWGGCLVSHQTVIRGCSQLCVWGHCPVFGDQTWPSCVKVLEPLSYEIDYIQLVLFHIVLLVSYCAYGCNDLFFWLWVLSSIPGCISASLQFLGFCRVSVIETLQRHCCYTMWEHYSSHCL